MPHLLIAGKIHEDGIALIRAAKGFTFDYTPEFTHEAYAPLIAKADGLIIRTQPVPAETIAQGTRLKIVSRHGVGYDAVDVPALNARGIPLTIIGDVNSRPVAEHAMMLMLALAKKVRDYDRATRQGPWSYRNSFEAIELHEKHLLIIGFGRIGRHVAKMAAGFGMVVYAYDPFQSADAIREGGAEPVTALKEGLAHADFVTVHMPMSGGKAVIGHDELAIMKSTATIVNTARGGLIDEDALHLALHNGAIAGAGLDVFLDEPPHKDHPLFASDKLIVTPHSASLSAESAVRMAVMSVQNALDYFEAKLDPSMVVNLPYLSDEARRHLKT